MIVHWNKVNNKYDTQNCPFRFLLCLLGAQHLMGVGRMFEGENRGLLDFAHYWFPSPARQGDRSVGFRNGGHSLSPPGEHAASQSANLVLIEDLLTHLNFSSCALCSFCRCVSHHLLPSWVIPDFAKVALLRRRAAWVFKEVSLEAAKEY